MPAGVRGTKAQRGTTAGRGRSRAAAVAALAGAVGLAAKNRDNLGAMMHRSGPQDEATAPAKQGMTPGTAGEPTPPGAARPMDPGDRPST